MEQPKSLFSWPTWQVQKISRTQYQTDGDRGRRLVSSRVAERTQLLMQLMDDVGVSLEGVRVRIEAWTQRPMEDLTATFEVLDVDRWLCISRIDFCPPSPHTNIHWRRCGLLPEVQGSHYHSIEDNLKLGADAFTRIANLTNARPLATEPQSFRDVVREIALNFHISDLSLDPPDWTGRLL